MAPTIGVNLRVTGHCSQGGRKYMEDMFSVAYQQTNDQLDLEYAFFGMFDGHGGSHAAEYAKEHLMRHIVNQPGFWSLDDLEICQAIKEGFLTTHYAMWNDLDNWPKTPSGLPSTSGTTASIAFIRKGKVYIGHVGDSGIVLGQRGATNATDPEASEQWIAVPLTEDHKPESPTELQRIHGSGGQVMVKSGVPRVVWQRPSPSHQGPLTRSTHIDQIPFLAVARSLGDLWSYNADSDEFVVSPVPDVTVLEIDLAKDRCLIFGTDGLFNMLSSQEAVEIVEKAEKNNKQAKRSSWMNPSKCLVDRAVAKWASSHLRADNTSAVVLLLDPLGPPKLPRCVTESCPIKSNAPKSNGMAICSWAPRKITKETIQTVAATSSSPKCASPKSSEPEDEDEEEEEEEKEDEEEEEEEEDDEEAPLSESSSHCPTRKMLRRAKKRKMCVPIARRNSSVSSDSGLGRTATRSSINVRTRRTRSEEPVRTEVVRNESDAENLDAPMRLRSAVAFKTLRSRNVNLSSSIKLPLSIGDEPRSKRVKK